MVFMNDNFIIYKEVLKGLYWVYDFFSVDDSYSMLLFNPTFHETASDLIAMTIKVNHRN